jgi:hypothetical protein
VLSSLSSSHLRSQNLQVIPGMRDKQLFSAILRFTSFSKVSASSTRSSFSPTASYKRGSVIYRRVRSGVRRTKRDVPTQTSPIKLDEATPGRRQDRMARTISARRLHRDEHGAPRRECRFLLQQARHMRAMMVWTAPDGIDCARMRSLQISDNGDRPWNRLAELAWTRRSISSSFME